MPILGDIYGAIDSAKRKVADRSRLLISDPEEFLRQHVANANQAAGTELDKLGALYKDPAGKPTFDPDKWSPTAASVHDDLVEQASGAVAGATAWHGSPHIFDKFKKEKIGTGEGAQAKGYGHYSGESRYVGEAYADSVTDIHNERRPSFTVGGQFYDRRNPMHVAAAAVDNNLGKVNEAVHEIWSAYKNPSWYDRVDRLTKEQAEAAIDYLRRYGGVNLPKLEHTIPMGRQLYKLDIPDEHIGRMLNWDKPMMEQRPEVLDRLGFKGGRGAIDDMRWEAEQGNLGKANQIGRENGLEYPSRSGAMAHWVKEAELGSEKAASKYFADRGLSGARHLDNFSMRGKAYTSNFVVFPEYEDIIQILGRETLKD